MRMLNLDILQEGLPGITPAQGLYYLEAAMVSLKKKGFSSGVHLKVEGNFEETIVLTWTQPVSKTTVDNWKNEQVVANFGAVAIALLLVRELLGFQVFEESTAGTGIDYWIKKGDLREEKVVFLEKEARLEISGIGKETPGNTLTMRINRKKKQISASDKTGLPGWIAVVEFGTPKSKIVKK